MKILNSEHFSKNTSDYYLAIFYHAIFHHGYVSLSPPPRQEKVQYPYVIKILICCLYNIFAFLYILRLRKAWLRNVDYTMFRHLMIIGIC